MGPLTVPTVGQKRDYVQNFAFAVLLGSLTPDNSMAR